jgi:Flp pilus assembly pilin Flp
VGSRQWRGPPTSAGVVRTVLQRLVEDEAGQDVVEYGMIIATITVVVLVVVTSFGANIEPWFQQLAGHITTTGT